MQHLACFRRLRCFAGGLLLALFSLVASSCHHDSADTAPAEPATIKLANSATLGHYLTDAQGNTLYFFAADIDGTNACTGGCLPTWPVFYEANVQVANDLQASDFNSKTTPDGRPQTTYKGWPLYYYAPATNGSGIGGVWHVASPDYTVLLARKAVVDKTTNQSASKTFLVDAQGRTLYYFAKDNAQPNTQPTNCDGACASVWPALYLSLPVVPASLTASNFATITRSASPTTGPYGTTAGSSQQLTYKGHPLYYYAADNATRGNVQGHNLSSYGDLWLVATP